MVPVTLESAIEQYPEAVAEVQRRQVASKARSPFVPADQMDWSVIMSFRLTTRAYFWRGEMIRLGTQIRTETRARQEELVADLIRTILEDVFIVRVVGEKYPRYSAVRVLPPVPPREFVETLEQAGRAILLENSLINNPQGVAR